MMNTQSTGDPICSVCGLYLAWHRKNCVQSNCVGFLDKPIGSINPTVSLINEDNNLKTNNMSKIKDIIKGLQIIEQYEENAIFAAEHDQVFAGEGNGKSITEITEEGKVILDNLGWFIDKDLKCWSRFV